MMYWLAPLVLRWNSGLASTVFPGYNRLGSFVKSATSEYFKYLAFGLEFNQSDVVDALIEVKVKLELVELLADIRPDEGNEFAKAETIWVSELALQETEENKTTNGQKSRMLINLMLLKFKKTPSKAMIHCSEARAMNLVNLR